MDNDIVIEIPTPEIQIQDDPMSQIAIFAFLQASDIEYGKAIASRFENKVKEAVTSPLEERKMALSLLHKMNNPEKDDLEIRSLRELQKMVAESTQEVYLEQNKKIQEIEKRMKKRMSKKTTALLSSVTTLCGVVITAIITYLTSRG